jgi:nucleotide-binding universal stress UspA family protein
MFKTVAVGTDGSETADLAVEIALDLAAHYGARLLVFSAYHPVGSARLHREKEDAPEEVQWLINPHEDVDEVLANVQARARERGVETTGFAREGEPARVICELAEEHAADLLVVGNKGIQRRVLGSVPKAVSQHAPCTVVIAKTT